MDHLHHFGISQDPFSNEPDLRLYFDSESHRDAQRRAERGLRQHKGLTLLTGDGGMGKTLVARRILEGLEDEIYEAGLIVMLPGAADASSVLARFARQLGVDEAADDRAALLGQIYEQLAIVREDGRHTVLIIDDAHILSPACISEIGGLLNLEYEDRRLVSLLLVGLPELDDLLAADTNLAQRVDVRVRLQPLDLGNAMAYLSHRLSAVGGRLEVIPPAAVEALYKLGRGRPRLLNTLGDNALYEAYLAGRSHIEPSDVERAAADLGIGADPGETFQAPMPRPGTTSGAGPASRSIRTRAPRTPSHVESSGSLRDVFGDSAGNEAELTRALAQEPSTSGTLDLDAGLEAVLEEQDDESFLPEFSAQNASEPAGASATRVASNNELPFDFGEADEPIEDLFVELIDD